MLAAERPFILGQISPEPTDLQRQAIEVALEQVAQDIFPADRQPSQPSTQWRFSGRWWNRSGTNPARF